jgi:hypothetical protein
MRHLDSPEGWQRHGERAEPAPRPRVTLYVRVVRFSLFVLFVAGALAGYVWIGRHTPLAGALPLPRSLQVASSAHEELEGYGESLRAIAVEVSGRILGPGPQNAPIARSLLARIDAAHRLGRALEPRLTREEGRVLAALQAGERLMRDHVAASVRVGDGYDPEALAHARAQLDHALGLLGGKPLEGDSIRRRYRPSRVGKAVDAARDVAGAGDRLRAFGAE